MRIARLIALSVLALSTSAAGCGGGGDDYETGRDVIEALSRALCGFGARCGELMGSEDACVDRLVAAACAPDDEPEPDDIACDEDVPADSEDELAQLEQCIDDLRDQACTEEDLPASCADADMPTDTLRALATM